MGLIWGVIRFFTVDNKRAKVDNKPSLILTIHIFHMKFRSNPS